MNCKVVRRRLLSLTHPEQVPAVLRAHLVHCEACREWHIHLVLLERHVSLIPIPSSSGKARLMRRLLRDQTIPCHDALTTTQAPGVDSPASLSRTPLDGGTLISVGHSLRPRTLALGAAAVLLVIVLSWLGI